MIQPPVVSSVVVVVVVVGVGVSVQINKAGYTAQDAPSMRTFHLRK